MQKLQKGDLLLIKFYNYTNESHTKLETNARTFSLSFQKSYHFYYLPNPKQIHDGYCGTNEAAANSPFSLQRRMMAKHMKVDYD